MKFHIPLFLHVVAIFLLLAFLEIPFACASVAVATDSRSPNFQAFLNLHPDLVRFSEFEVQTLPSAEEKQEVLESFIKAKKLYLSSNLQIDRPAAQKIFLTIMEISRRQPWMNEMRSLFFDSALYLAVLEKTVAKRHEWLEEALKWRASRILWVEWPDFIQKEYLSISEALRSRSPSQLNLGDLHVQRATLDGLPLDVESNQAITLSPGEHRLVLLDDEHVPEMVSINQKSVDDLKSPDRNIISGSCEHPSVASAFETLPLTIFFSPNCIWNKTALGKWTRWKDVASPAVLDLGPSGYFENRAAWPKPIEDTDRFYKKPLFWAGVIAVVALAVKIQSDQGHTSEPERVATP